jgi:hypothetical protein
MERTCGTVISTLKTERTGRILSRTLTLGEPVIGGPSGQMDDHHHVKVPLNRVGTGGNNRRGTILSSHP